MHKGTEKRELLKKKTVDILRKGLTEESLHELLMFYYQDVISCPDCDCADDYDREVYLPL